ncbi:MAG: hypothetical protein PHS41_11285 [Victivallaceae bacterium]|nr:hypothetical protein [Victivallaceae bacterium]
MAQMHWYSPGENCSNSVSLSPEDRCAIKCGLAEVSTALLHTVLEHVQKTKRPCIVALDGYFGAEWSPVVKMMMEMLKKKSQKAICVDSRTLYYSKKQEERLIARYTNADPTLGIACTDKLLPDMLDPLKVQNLQTRLRSWKKQKGGDLSVIFVHGTGAAVPALRPFYDKIGFFDVGRIAITMRKFAGVLREPYLAMPAEVSWKKEMYFYYHIMDKYRKQLLPRIDFYVDGNDAQALKFVPRMIYDSIMEQLGAMPLKFRRFMQPGNWGGLHHSKYFNLPELKNCAWDTTFYGPKNTLIVNYGGESSLEIPFLNVQEKNPSKIVGPYLAKKFPGLLPMIACIDDGYFPKPVAPERSNMPLHLHPDNAYARKTFHEHTGRYETYYIVDAYENANTMLGFTRDANVEEFKQKIIDSDQNKVKFDWMKYVKTWPSRSGDLYLIPAGTVHGTGGHQMILEMDTCPSNTGTEYSFFLYDFLRPSWDDDKKDFSASPVRLQIKHGLRQLRNYRREDWVREHLLAKPQVIRKGDTWCEDRYSTYHTMPFWIERLHFQKEISSDTQGRFCHLLVLTEGEKALIQSKSNPERQIVLDWIQFALIPAGFGEYRCINIGSTPRCTIVKQRWKRG